VLEDAIGKLLEAVAAQLARFGGEFAALSKRSGFEPGLDL
jgi:hypothetical protein